MSTVAAEQAKVSKSHTYPTYPWLKFAQILHRRTPHHTQDASPFRPHLDARTRAHRAIHVEPWPTFLPNRWHAALTSLRSGDGTLISTTSAENISQSTTELTEQGTFPRFPLLRAELSQACSPGSEHFELPARRGQLPVSAGRRNPQLGHNTDMSRQASVTTARQRKSTNAILALGNGKSMLFCSTNCCLRRRTTIPPRLSTSCDQLAQSRKCARPHTKRSTARLRLNVAPWSPARSCWTGSLSQPRCMTEHQRVNAQKHSPPHLKFWTTTQNPITHSARAHTLQRADRNLSKRS